MMRFRQSNGGSGGYNRMEPPEPSTTNERTGDHRGNNVTKTVGATPTIRVDSFAADTIMDLATPSAGYNPRIAGVASFEAAPLPSQNISYQMEEKKSLHPDDEMDQIISAVSKDLKKNSRAASRAKARAASASRARSTGRPPRLNAPKPLVDPETASAFSAPTPTIASTTAGSTTATAGTVWKTATDVPKSEIVRVVSPRGHPETSQEPPPNRGSTTAASSNYNKPSKPKQQKKQRSTKKGHISRRATKDAEVAVVSDDESGTRQSSDGSGFPHFLHKMMYDESVGSTNNEESVDYDYNYIDDESYGNTSRSSSSSSHSYSTRSSYDRKGRNHRSKHDNESQYSTSTTSRSNDTGDYFDDPELSRVEEEEEAEDQSNSIYDDEDRSEAFRYAQEDFPQGLDIVAQLLEGEKEICLKASAVIADTSGKNTPIHEIARHVSDAIAQTSYLQKISFVGPWRGDSNRARVVLEILFDGLIENTSVHTIVFRDNPCFDRYAGYAFGTMIRANSLGKIRKLEILRCKFVGSGWNSMFLGLQHSSSIKVFSVENCKNLTSDNIDSISSTLQYLGFETIRLCNVNLHTIKIENLSFLLRAVQQTKSLKKVDLSENNLGKVPRAILLLAKCLAGDPVWIDTHSSSNSETLSIHYQHHIETLILSKCGIVDKAALRTLVRALDSTRAKLDANRNEHPLKLTHLDLNHNRFGNSGAKIVQKLVDDNPQIAYVGMVGCSVSASKLKTMADRLRYNNSFLQKLGLGSNVSLAILDSYSAFEHACGRGSGKNPSPNGVAMLAEGGEETTELETTGDGACACIGCS